MIKDKVRYKGKGSFDVHSRADLKVETQITEDNFDELESLGLLDKHAGVIGVDRQTWKSIRKGCRHGRTFELNSVFGNGNSYFRKYGKDDYRNVDTGARVIVSSKLHKLGYQIKETNQNTIAGRTIHDTIKTLNTNDLNEVSSSIEQLTDYEIMEKYKEVA